MPNYQFAPRTHAFAVVRMDPVAMVRHLGDPEATQAAEALSPKSYPVFVEFDSALPFPGKPWYGLTVYLIGPHLRPAVEEDCVTTDMCSPIFPNANHPEGRDPVRTQPVFPFDNCYFWSGVSMEIRVCARPEGFDWEPTTLLRGEEYMKWEHYESEDMARRVWAQRAREPQPAQVNVPSNPSPPLYNDSGVHGAVESTYVDSLYSYAASCVSLDRADCESVDTMMEMGLLPDPTENFELQPFFHLWSDLAATLKQDEIPSPDSLLEECDAITRIIQEARERNPSLPPLPIPNPFGDAAPSDTEYSASIRDWSAGTKPTVGNRVLQMLGKVGLRVRNMLRMPYIPVWP